MDSTVISAFGTSGGKKSGAKSPYSFLKLLSLIPSLCGKRHLSSRVGRGCRLKVDNILLHTGSIHVFLPLETVQMNSNFDNLQTIRNKYSEKVFKHEL